MAQPDRPGEEDARRPGGRAKREQQELRDGAGGELGGVTGFEHGGEPVLEELVLAVEEGERDEPADDRQEPEDHQRDGHGPGRLVGVVVRPDVRAVRGLGVEVQVEVGHERERGGLLLVVGVGEGHGQGLILGLGRVDDRRLLLAVEGAEHEPAHAAGREQRGEQADEPQGVALGLPSAPAFQA